MSKYDQVTVTVQPGSGTAAQNVVPDDWLMPPPPERTPVNCPRGLEHLALMDEIYIYQKISWAEICLGCEWNQKYDIMHPESGKKIYKGLEDTSFCTRFWCANGRPLEMSIVDHENKEVIHLHRPFRCAGMMCPPCMDEFTVSAPDGSLFGTVKQTFAWCIPKFDVFNANGECVLKIQGPCWHCSCGGEVPFKIYAVGEHTEIGVIAKRWTGLAKECCTDVDNFRIAFPPNLDVRIKAVLIGACFSIDLMFFENQDQ